jgi:hypothetical protein
MKTFIVVAIAVMAGATSGRNCNLPTAPTCDQFGAAGASAASTSAGAATSSVAPADEHRRDRIRIGAAVNRTIDDSQYVD